MTAWAHLLNAQHIDAVLAHLRANLTKWGAAREAERGAARDAAWGAARGAARDAAWEAAWGAAREAAQDALLALVAYDDLGWTLGPPAPVLHDLYDIGKDPRLILLLPMAYAMTPDTEPAGSRHTTGNAQGE